MNALAPARTLACAALIAAGALAPTPPATAAPARPPSATVPTLAPEELKAGQKAVVRTVFQGSTIESFDAEIVGVLPGGRAEGDMILARATTPRVVQSGIAQGMSGSPVYVDGKLVGALSGGWQFTREPLFGITPIREMLPVLERPAAPVEGGTGGPSGADLEPRSAGAAYGAFRWDDAPDVAAEAAIPAARPAGDRAGLRTLSLPLACGGLHPDAWSTVSGWLGPLGLSAVPGGQAADGGPRPDDLVPGAAVAIDVLRGDVQLAAIGTVTYRDRDGVLVFGHPFFQSGDVRLPLATAEIVTIVPSEQISFKLGVRGRSVGTVTQDRRAAVAGRIGDSPSMLPLAVDVRDLAGRRQSFRFESIEDRAMAPTLVAIAALNSVLESGGTGANQTMRWTLRLHRKGAAPLILTDVAASDSPSQEMANALAAPLRFLYNNPYARLDLDSVSVDVRAEPGRDLWNVRNARLLAARVRPGATLQLQVEVERWRGARDVREIRLQVPDEVPAGRYVLWVGGGAELARFEAARLPGRYRPTSLDDAWRRLAEVRSGDALYAALFARAPEITSEGRDYPELPVSALALFANPQGAGDRTRRGDLAKLDERRTAMDGAVRGELQIAVDVDPAAP